MTKIAIPPRRSIHRHPDGTLTPTAQASIDYYAVKKYKRWKLPPRAALMANFIETYCCFSKGGFSSAFTLIPWEYEVLRGVYTGLPGDPFEITRALISMARKNGKTEFASALVLVHLAGPESGWGDEIVMRAAADFSKDQARLVFDGAKVMARANPVIAAHMTIMKERLIWKENANNNAAYPTGTKASSAQGKLPSFVTFDEIAEEDDRDLYESYNLASMSRYQLMFIISTRSTRPESIFTELHDEAVNGQANGINKHWYVKVYSADPKAANLFSKAQLKKANPAWDYFMDQSVLEQDRKNAEANATARPEYRARRLNIESGKKASLVDPQVWANAARVKDRGETTADLFEEFADEIAVLGLDLGSTRSLTSLAIYWPKHGFVHTRNFMAESQVKNNETMHKFPYREVAADGHLELVAHAEHGGMVYEPIADAGIAECFGDIRRPLVSI